MVLTYICFVKAALQQKIRACIITGSGDSFSAGGDLGTCADLLSQYLMILYVTIGCVYVRVAPPETLQ